MKIGKATLGMFAVVAGVAGLRREAVSQSAPTSLVAMARCLDVEGGVSANLRAVRIWDCNGTPAQRWLVSGARIENVMGRCLDVEGGVSANRRAVRLYDCNGTPAQQWSIRGNQIQNVMGRCPDVGGGVSANGRGVQLYDCNGTPAQQWTQR